MDSIKVKPELLEFVNNEVLPELGFEESFFWNAVKNIILKFQDRNKTLLHRREELQNLISNWHENNVFEVENYKKFLEDIDYLLPKTKPFLINTQDIDPEIASIAGPQLVVPITNARFSLNATNARWGSLYDALYGTDVISEENGCSKGSSYNIKRGMKVIEYAKNFLDSTFPIMQEDGELYPWNKISKIEIKNHELFLYSDADSEKILKLANDFFKGYTSDMEIISSILLENNGLHVQILIDPDDQIGKDDIASIKDILLESAITTIQDCEDSVAAVDAEDKVMTYKNWLGLMKGNLQESFIKGDTEIIRKLDSDKEFIGLDGKTFTLPGRSLLLVRNVGLLMTNPSITLGDDTEVFEGILDAIFTICIGLFDIRKLGSKQNSKTGSIYIVKPKMHGPEEVEFSCDLFAEIESVFNIPKNTVKIGIMDEERRTTLNLAACIEKAKDRIIFINTGFLDRTGDEIHTSMNADAMVPKSIMKNQKWIQAYEDWNVGIGLRCGFSGKAQIGKGMWAMPDLMKDMVKEKILHPASGANCAWVPSPTAATLHAMHYHQINVFDQHKALKVKPLPKIQDLLEIPTNKDNLPSDVIEKEIENCAQGILGYVVRWIDQGIGCSKVPDINDIGLMEDRATCRISSQLLANWLHHKLCSEDHIISAFKKMAVKVDEQNQSDANYVPMSPTFNGYAFQAALELVLKGSKQPSGYTEPLLHKWRLLSKKSTP